jgi:hypothetical protein
MCTQYSGFGSAGEEEMVEGETGSSGERGGMGGIMGRTMARGVVGAGGRGRADRGRELRAAAI